MDEHTLQCFVMMPFLPELHYFYLYMKQHVERVHQMKCERADDQVLTVPILEKISEMIRRADVVIADCSGRNPNVFYELGIAHAHGKKVILLINDIKEAPSDVRHFEFIVYQLDRHVEFLSKLDNALNSILVERYDDLFSHAGQVFQEFRRAATIPIELAPKALFVERVRRAERIGQEVPEQDDLTLAEFVLPKIIADSTDAAIMTQITEWLTARRPTM